MRRFPCVSLVPPLQVRNSDEEANSGARRSRGFCWELFTTAVLSSTPKVQEKDSNIETEERYHLLAVNAETGTRTGFALGYRLNPTSANKDQDSDNNNSDCVRLFPFDSSQQKRQVSPDHSTEWFLHRFEGAGIVFEAAVRKGAYLTDDALLVDPATCSGMPGFTESIAFAPVVDISPLIRPSLRGNATADTAAASASASALKRACKDVGFAFLVGHGGLGSEAQHLARLVQAQFSGGKFEKITLASSTGTVKTNFNPPTFAQIVPWLRDAAAHARLEAYFEKAGQLSEDLLDCLLEKKVDMGEIYLLLRGVCYPVIAPAQQPLQQHEPEREQPATKEGGEQTEEEGGRNIGKHAAQLDLHTDKSWVTVLAATVFDGLFTMDCDGEGLAAVKFPKQSQDAADDGEEEEEEVPLVLNVGDALEMYSKGKYIARLHCAKNVGKEKRVSLPLFVEPRPDCWPKQYEPTQLVMYEF